MNKKDRDEIKRLARIIKYSNDNVNVAIAGTMLVKLSKRIRKLRKGREGGRYTYGNCILVCQHHHRGIEGMAIKETLATKCTKEEYRKIKLHHLPEPLRSEMIHF